MTLSSLIVLIRLKKKLPAKMAVLLQILIVTGQTAILLSNLVVLIAVVSVTKAPILRLICNL
jgi:hypothetical protein